MSDATACFRSDMKPEKERQSDRKPVAQTVSITVCKYQYSRFVGPNPSAPKTLPSIKASTSGFLEMGRLVNRTQVCVKADGNPEVIDSRD